MNAFRKMFGAQDSKEADDQLRELLGLMKKLRMQLNSNDGDGMAVLKGDTIINVNEMLTHIEMVFTEQVNALECDKAKALKELEESSNQVKALDCDKERVQEELDLSSLQVEGLERDKEWVQEELGASSLQVEGLERDKEKVQKERDALSKEVSLCKGELTTAIEEKVVLSGKLDLMSNVSKVTEAELKASQEEMMTQSSAHQLEVEDFKKQIDDTKSENEALTRQLRAELAQVATGPHRAQFLRKAGDLPGLDELSHGLDANYRLTQHMLLCQSFHADQDVAEEMVNSETHEDRAPAKLDNIVADKIGTAVGAFCKASLMCHAVRTLGSPEEQQELALSSKNQFEEAIAKLATMLELGERWSYIHELQNEATMSKSLGTAWATWTKLAHFKLAPDTFLQFFTQEDWEWCSNSPDLSMEYLLAFNDTTTDVIFVDHATSMETLSPEGGCGLSSLEHLKRDVDGLHGRAPEFFDAICGPALLASVSQILEKYPGPQRAENDYMRVAVNHVYEKIKTVYGTSQQAALDRKERDDNENRIISKITSTSEDLSGEFLSDRVEKENTRNDSVMALMSFFMQKLNIAGDRDQVRQILSESQQHFEEVNAGQLTSLHCRSKQHNTKAEDQRRKIMALEDYEIEKTREEKHAHVRASWARLVCNARLTDIDREISLLLHKARFIMCDTREKLLEKDRASCKLRHTKMLVELSAAKLEQRAQEHDKLCNHYAGSAELLSEFKSVMVDGYTGLTNKSEADAETLLQGLPRDRSKILALRTAYEEDLVRQKMTLITCSAETATERTEVEKQLRTLEQKRRKDPALFQDLKTQYEDHNKDLEQYEQDLQELDAKLGKCCEIASRYKESFEKVLPSMDLPSGEAEGTWLSSFLFNARKCTRYQPTQRMLMCDPESMTSSAWTEVANLVPEGSSMMSSLDTTGTSSAHAQEAQSESVHTAAANQAASSTTLPFGGSCVGEVLPEQGTSAEAAEVSADSKGESTSSLHRKENMQTFESADSSQEAQCTTSLSSIAEESMNIVWPNDSKAPNLVAEEPLASDDVTVIENGVEDGKPKAITCGDALPLTGDNGVSRDPVEEINEIKTIGMEEAEAGGSKDWFRNQNEAGAATLPEMNVEEMNVEVPASLEFQSTGLCPKESMGKDEGNNCDKKSQGPPSLAESDDVSTFLEISEEVHNFPDLVTGTDEGPLPSEESKDISQALVIAHTSGTKQDVKDALQTEIPVELAMGEAVLLETEKDDFAEVMEDIEEFNTNETACASSDFKITYLPV